MRQMLRRLSPLVVFAALLFAAEPLLHTHPLQGNAPGASETATCAICATGVGRLPSVTASVAAPQAIVYTYFTIAVPVVAANDPLPLPSRAPPAA